MKRYLRHFYQTADAVITPTEYSKSLIAGYGVQTPIYVVSNGIDLSRYVPNPQKEQAFRIILS